MMVVLSNRLLGFGYIEGTWHGRQKTSLSHLHTFVDTLADRRRRECSCCCCCRVGHCVTLHLSHHYLFFLLHSLLHRELSTEQYPSYTVMALTPSGASTTWLDSTPHLSSKSHGTYVWVVLCSLQCTSVCRYIVRKLWQNRVWRLYYCSGISAGENVSERREFGPFRFAGHFLHWFFSKFTCDF